MLPKLRKKRAKVESTPFSDFIRNASLAEKERVYNKILTEAALEQKRIIVSVRNSL